MLILNTITDQIEVITDAAVNTDVHASWMDYDGTDVTPGRTNVKITTATTTVVVDNPAASVTRNVKTLHIQNVHASSSVLVTIQFNDNATLIVLESVTLLAGERIAYVEGQGFELVDAAGITKTAAVVIAGDLVVKALAASVTNSTTTAAKITGLDTVCGTGTWVFEYFLRFQSATSSVGPKLSVNHTGTVTHFMQTVTVLTAAALDSSGVFDQSATAPQVMGGMALRAKDATASMIGTAGVDTVDVNILIQITGLAVVTVSGNLELYHASETATATRIESGSSLRLTKVG